MIKPESFNSFTSSENIHSAQNSEVVIKRRVPMSQSEQRKDASTHKSKHNSSKPRFPNSRHSKLLAESEFKD